MDKSLHHFETIRNHICLLVFDRGIMPWLLGWCRISSIHSMAVISTQLWVHAPAHVGSSSPRWCGHGQTPRPSGRAWLFGSLLGRPVFWGPLDTAKKGYLKVPKTDDTPTFKLRRWMITGRAAGSYLLKPSTLLDRPR